MELYIILALIAVIVFQQVMHGKERKDLYTRWMARDLTEYNHAVQHEKLDPKQSAMQKKLDEYKKQWK
jgi:hypothetical protein